MSTISVLSAALRMTDDLDWVRLKAAEKLGWREVEYSRDGYLVGHGPGRKDIKVVPSYARDTRAAWEIVEALMSVGADVTIGTTPRKIKEYAVEVRLSGSPVTRAVHEYPATAICLAFLECEHFQVTKNGPAFPCAGGKAA